MKKAFKPALFLLLMCGVFGVDEVESVSVMEGDSVTLNPDQTQIQGYLEIEWWFKDQLIASIDGSKPTYPNERFRGRLKLNQTGSLTITNMKTKHSGLYHLQIELNSGPVHVNFTVTVYESPSVIDAGKAEMKSVSVMSGDRVTLQTGVTQISGEELIVWRFGEEGKLIAKADIEAKSSPLYYDERFRDRLELDQTGSLTITNTNTTDSGLYTVKISSSKQTLHKRFTVSVTVTVTVIEPGLSPGAVAGIVLVFLAAVAAAAAGFIYYRRKISELRKQTYEGRHVFVPEGESIHLSTDRPKIERDDEIQWRFRDEIIAEVKEGTGKTHDGPDGRFRDRLQLNVQTGDLTIKSSTTEHTGDYQLNIRSSKGKTDKTYGVTITWRCVYVTVGESVHLSTDLPKIERDDEIQWMCGDEIIAEVKEGTGKTHDGADERFRDRLQLNVQTGDLTIKNSTAKDTGDYNLNIRSSKGKTDKTYGVTITLTVPVTVKVGEYIILKPNKEIQKGDVMQWMFGEEEKQTSIAKFIVETGEFVKYDYAVDGRFKDTLKLDKTTGSLIIRNSRPAHSGLYTLYITSSSGYSEQRFIVTVKETLEEISVEEGDTVTLKPDTEIQRDEEIQWMFGKQDNVIAQIREETGEICIYNDDAADGRFRGRLKLEKTGSLTITDITAQHTGLYKLLTISSSGGTLCKRFRVYMQLRDVFVTEGESVHLATDRPIIERDDEIEWMCGDEIIAEIKGETGKTHDGADGRFRDRLQLNVQTGDLTIKSSTDEDTGRYKLKISNSKGNRNWTYRVTIRDKVTGKLLMKRNNGKRVDESAVEMQPLLDK